jgi:hypothetical protein
MHARDLQGDATVRIHLHTYAWNDARMLGFFFRHYAPLVEHFFIYDDGSDDATFDILGARSDVTVERIARVEADSYIESIRHVANQNWKRSRGVADWVIFADIDEHVVHDDLAGYLARQLAAGVTAIPTLGYQMLTDSFPAPGALLSRDHTWGAPWQQMSKLQIFRPDRITETHYTAGRHRAAPTGDVVYPDRDEVLTLHYKYLGLDYVMARHRETAARRGAVDLAKGYAHRHGFDEDEIRKDIAAFAARAVDIRDIRGGDHHVTHAEPRWWRA